MQRTVTVVTWGGRRSHPAYARTEEWCLPVVSVPGVATRTANTCQPSVLLRHDPSAPLNTADHALFLEIPSSFDFRTPGFLPSSMEQHPRLLHWLSLIFVSFKCGGGPGSSPQTTLFHQRSLLRGSCGADSHADISSLSSATSTCKSHGEL